MANLDITYKQNQKDLIAYQVNNITVLINKLIQVTVEYSTLAL